MKQKLNILKCYPVAAYFILVFVISWGSVFLFLGPDGLPVALDQVQMIGMALLLGTTGAMLILTATVDGKAGFRNFGERLIKWKVNGSYYAVALLTAPVTAMITLLVLSVFGPQFTPKIIIADDKIQLIGMGVAAGFFIAFFEEVGWTGFAVPRMLEKHGILLSGLLTGSLWVYGIFLLSGKMTAYLGLYLCYYFWRVCSLGL
ncbi:type II CAAX prenyl endopeptidase Rce1 family protein [Marispirochaeta sp.]|uniref:CPBP family glutamic-type intramembrane protease n=1 Tax=Marispirochaeta sp. TaxID=2038653 RepID=UPI0029C92CF2|nr:CPBP family glutamic-type intramembrane protease [Marispirochaeta sp.]